MPLRFAGAAARLDARPRPPGGDDRASLDLVRAIRASREQGEELDAHRAAAPLETLASLLDQGE